jgi:ABC-type branched-subunit amino acid transport system substrate-binding protein
MKTAGTYIPFKIYNLKFKIILWVCLCASLSLSAQGLKKSKKVETVDGKKFYMHTVEKGQTLYAIAHAYELKVNDIVIENPGSIDGIKQGQVLKIPFTKEQAKDGLKLGQAIIVPAESVRNSNAAPPEPTGVKQAATESRTILGSDTSRKMNNFNIGVFLPFRTAETTDMDIDKLARGEEVFPGKSEVAIQFYHGIQLAVDSLKKTGLCVKIHVYDFDEGDSVQFQNFLKNPELLSLNLMIGPLYTADFVPLARFAKENRIFIISPLSQQNKILFNNPYVSKVTASITTQTEQMADYVAQKYKGQRIIVVNSGKPKDASFVKAFMKEANEALKQAGTDSVCEARGFWGIGNFIQPSKKNIVVVPSADKAFVTDFITKLNTLREKNPIVLFGLECWTDFDNLDLDYLSNMSLHFPSTAFVDYGNEQVLKFIHAYAGRYTSDPGTFAFEGYDVAFYYLKMLRAYGSNFQNKLASNKQAGLQTGFDFYQVSAESGFENKAVFMLMYQDYKLVKAE